jgi:hypothetical protein
MYGDDMNSGFFHVCKEASMTQNDFL